MACGKLNNSRDLGVNLQDSKYCILNCGDAKRRKISPFVEGDDNPPTLSETSPQNTSTKAQRRTEQRIKERKQQRERRNRRLHHGLLTEGDPAAFALRYEQHAFLDSGGFSCVYAGMRRSDQLPVAIKYIPIEDVEFVPMIIGGQFHYIPLEVVMMCQAGSGPHSMGKNTSVAILDWFIINQMVMLVQERPPKAEDLFDFCLKQAPLSEVLAKEITRQVVEAVTDLHHRGIFHRDVKASNILISDTPAGPRIRMIDFGIACWVHQEPYYIFKGTPLHAPPEVEQTKCYSAGPTTVWHIGGLLYEMLCLHEDQFTSMAYLSGNLPCPSGVSEEGLDFLVACLEVDPNKRLCLDQLRHHPWFQT